MHATTGPVSESERVMRLTTMLELQKQDSTGVTSMYAAVRKERDEIKLEHQVREFLRNVIR